ncbi:MAG: ATP-binding cassette domain-containing protein [Candidatus Pacearchaeota archaeon]
MKPKQTGESRKDAVVVKDLKKSFKKLHVLKGIEFSVERGTVLAILGPNGAGKTTTIKILSTLLSLDSGKVIVNGYDVVSDPDKVKKSIGLTGQYAAVDEYLSGEENLIMMGQLYRLTKRDAIRRTKELLVQFDLVDAAKRAVKTYSGGMRRRLDLAMSLIASPPIIFLDEPTTGLDPRSRLTMWKIIKDLVSQGTTVLLTTQYMEEADQLANKIIVIDHGKVIAQGTAHELKTKVGSERLQLVMATQKDFKNALEILGNIIQSDVQNRTINVSVDEGVSTLKEVLDKLDYAKIKVETLSLHRPTLDDVFLSLTGHTASKEDAKEESK